MVEEQFGEQTQILGVRLVFAAVDLEKRDRLLPVDFIARWVS